MKPPSSIFILLSCVFIFQACQTDTALEVKTSKLVVDNRMETLLGQGYDFEGNGKDYDATPLEDVFTKATVDTFNFPLIKDDFVQALEQHLRLLKLRKQKKKQKIGNLNVNLDQLKQTIQELLAWQHSKPSRLLDNLDAYQIWGEDKKGNVHFTGYFTPIIKVNKHKTDRYKYPIYAYPKDWEGRLPTRRNIEEGGALLGKGLELAYAENKVDVYFMQVQGSGYVEYPDGRQELFAYSGTNKHPYQSIGRYLVERNDIDAKNISLDGIRKFLGKNPHLVDTVLFINKSYTFFIPKKFKPKGAGHVPLTADHSIAVDRRYLPLGSCLLAQIPIIDKAGNLQRHEWRLLLAQDIGGAIKGAGHVDVYSGIGIEGKNKASAFHHYGKMWLLLPKEEDVLPK